MSQRRDFVFAARAGGVPFARLCRDFGISRKTGYKWLSRALAGSDERLADRPRTPHASPRRTDERTERAVLDVRDRFPGWGARKLHAFLLRDRPDVAWPAVSTFSAILRRHGRIDPACAARHRPFVRFERAAPHDLWQMDFKGHVPLAGGPLRLHPLTVLDDHSRFLIALHAACEERRLVVWKALVAAMRIHGKPEAILCDNGPPWGACGEPRPTRLAVELMLHDVRVLHGRPHHPQTQGKDERFHRTLLEDLLARNTFASLAEAQAAFDAYRRVYNELRPHQAIGMQTPLSRYRPSTRLFRDTPAPWIEPPGAVCRCVDAGGRISLHGTLRRIGRGLVGRTVRIEPHPERDGLLQIYFRSFRVLTLPAHPTDDDDDTDFDSDSDGSTADPE